ncbi:MAG: hypothetical protein M1569_01260 [Candidatus Marsarchaeota archaeon]|nr:hypothetical protein [Candidatus Marsarchaeota archaeon]MCL5413017.1 hypothetical protein [Candidatus Marsarchaeota archaeon]
MNYEESVQAIGAAETSGTGGSQAAVDVYDLGPEVAIRKYTDVEVESTLTFIESTERTAASERAPEAQRVQATGSAAVARMQGSVNAVRSEIKSFGTGVRGAEATGMNIAREKEDAIARELGSLISKAEGEFSDRIRWRSEAKAANGSLKRNPVSGQKQPNGPSAPAKRETAMKQQPLVLPGLSLQDQIIELEKINSVIDSNSLTGGQLDIIKIEIKGLLADRSAQPGNVQPGLSEIRDARLAEIARKIGLG